MDATNIDKLVAETEKLSLGTSDNGAAPVLVVDEAPTFPSPKPAELANLRRKIEAGDYQEVEEIIWANPRTLVTVCDSAVYLMAGPKYNACHIAARANKPDIMAMILDTVANFSFLRKLYPNESDANLKDRANHLTDSYLNTPDPRQGNTPLHFACKLGFYRVIRVLLTFEGCDLNLRDSNGRTAKESICIQTTSQTVAAQLNESITPANTTLNGSFAVDTSIGPTAAPGPEEMLKKKIANLFKQQLHLPSFRDQLKKRLVLERRRSRCGSQLDADTSYSDLDDSFILSPAKQRAT